MFNREKLEKFGLYDSRFEHDSCGVGFVCNIKGNKSHEIIKQGLEVLKRLSHRGATGADPKTGDGAGILIQIPHEFFAGVCADNKIDLPRQGKYGTGLVFLPLNEKERQFQAWFNNSKLLADVVYYDKDLEQAIQNHNASGSCCSTR